MGTLRNGCTAIALALTPGLAAPAQAAGVEDWQVEIEEASRRFGVPAEWIARVMRAESGGRTHLNGRPITSHAGAMGLMQLMPGTWADMRARLGLAPDPHAPRDNILAGTYYLRLMYERFGYPGLFGAYNAGPARYGAYLAGKSGLPAETRAYMASVGGSVEPLPPTKTSGPMVGLFFVRHAGAEKEDSGSPLQPSLFVPLRGEASASGKDQAHRTQ